MGCVNSKPDINDQHPNMFQVTNVNDQGDLISPGQLEVTDTELVLYQRSKQPTIWPLRSLRKYGYDSGIFSFECGRRCPTGEGIYAFQCRKAEQLFNIVQQHIARNLNDDLGPTLSPNGEFIVPVASTGPPVQRRMPSQPEGYLNPVSVSGRTVPVLTRPDSIASNGNSTPTATSPPPFDPPLEHNNNKRASLGDHQYINATIFNEGEPLSPNYANLGINSPSSTVENYVNTSENSCHLYMNTNLPEQAPPEDDMRHCYANIDAKDLEHLKPLLRNSIDLPPSAPQTPTALYVTVHEVNYAELDLDNGKNEGQSQPTPDSPNKERKSYATIDFQRTNALSQSINPRMEIEEGSRKTRHNSTISDATTSTLSE